MISVFYDGKLRGASKLVNNANGKFIDDFIKNKDIIFYRAGDIHSKLAFQITKTIFKNTVSYRITCKKRL